MLQMKWKNPGIAYFGGGGSSGGSTSGDTTQTPTFTSSMEELAGQTFGTQEELDAAEQQVNTQNTISGTQEQIQAVASDPQSAFNTSQQNITNLQTEIDTLTGQLADNPGLQDQIDSLTSQLNQEQTNLSQAQQLVNQQQATAQQQLASAAMQDPSSIIQKAEVAATQVSPDQLIDQSVGQAGAAPQAETTTVEETATATTPAREAASAYDAATIDDQVQAATEDLQAAVAEPSEKATVRGQLAMLMEDFEGGETPPWASGPMRQAMGVMQSRGMGASSMAGAAVVQAAMESAISIASQDANTNAQFEMANLNNQQQTTIFKTQQRLAGLFSDQAAQNASRQFNASSENQTSQFFANLEATASQFNAAQINAIRQFNAGQENATEQFNATMLAQRQQFETQNALIISQANAQWRQNIATAETAAQNMANLEYTKNANAITGAQLDQIWQRERDLMDYAFTASESSLDRANSIILAKMGSEAQTDAMKLQAKMEGDAAFGSFIGQVAMGLMGIKDD